MTRARIYTKTGDTGETRLWDGTEVGKNDLHIETNGVLDELNAAVGLAKSLAPQCMKDELEELQARLMTLMAYIARGRKPQPAPDPARLESWIDRINIEYPMDGRFVHPGESPTGGTLHLARAIARRAERTVLPLFKRGGDIEAQAYQYINRLSDLLFALAHKADMETSVERVTREIMQGEGLEEFSVSWENLNLDAAIPLIAEARKKASLMGCQVVIAVCDASGELISLERMDDALSVSVGLAQSKARSAVRMRLDTKDIAPLVQPGAQLFGLQDEPGGFSIIGGGRLLRAGGEVVGAVGVSGGSVEEDLAIADVVVAMFERMAR